MRTLAATLALSLASGLTGAARADPLAGCLPAVSTQAPRAQLQNGTLTCTDGVMTATAGPKQDGRVGKAAAILPFGRRAGPGTTVTARAEVFIPGGAPIDSIHLMDLECKDCGVLGNPGLRLYLRDGRLRIDRAKIGERHAWVNDTAPRLPVDRWVTVEWTLKLSDHPDGWARVTLDAATVLEATGRTVPRGPLGHGIDRLQIGVTANSNPTAATVRLRRIGLALSVGADG